MHVVLLVYWHHTLDNFSAPLDSTLTFLFCLYLLLLFSFDLSHSNFSFIFLSLFLVDLIKSHNFKLCTSEKNKIIYICPNSLFILNSYINYLLYISSFTNKLLKFNMIKSYSWWVHFFSSFWSSNLGESITLYLCSTAKSLGVIPYYSISLT